ncbi:MAG: hypothetical protein HY807_12175 [Nitrospirae bacterium]|nr:hypothetical protein [Nitrospirota bacterium]
MKKEEIENILGTKIEIKNNKTNIGWETRKGDEIIDYRGLDLTFKNDNLISISWYGVDP